MTTLRTEPLLILTLEQLEMILNWKGVCDRECGRDEDEDELEEVLFSERKLLRKEQNEPE